MKTKDLVILIGFVGAPLLGCASSAVDRDDAQTPGTNTQHYEAQRTSGLPNYGADADQPAPAPTVKHAPTAAAPAALPTRTVAAGADRCKPIVVSANAVGLPCETTAEFIRSLNLGQKRTAEAMEAVQRAETSLAH